MNTKRWMSITLIIVLSVSAYYWISGNENSASAAGPGRLTTGLALTARAGSSIDFKTQNGRQIDGADADVSEIPLLTLKRNGQLTAPEERTLVIQLSGIRVPSPGVTVTLRIETQHEEQFLNGAESSRIQVWNGSQWIANPQESTLQELDASFTIEFGESISTSYGTIPTPTDYFRYQVLVTGLNGSNTTPLAQYAAEYAFLMENQWVTQLPQVLEQEPGAAPDALVVYYADMFNYERDPSDPSSRLHRDQVQGFVSHELVPAMLEAYRLQSEAWGFTWYPEWTSYRPGMDSERLSVALNEAGLWYHGWAPASAHSGISISTSYRSYASYDTLLDGMMSAFYHELFHNHQRGINLRLGGDGDVSGEGNAMAFFTEGMAMLASSVAGQPVEYASSRAERDYFTQANAFIAGDEFHTDGLNTSYAELDVYTAAVYWRFLYDQCGGMTVIRRTLEVLYSLEEAVGSPAELVEGLPEIMDRVLASPESGSCPFRTYADSLVRFATAIYALRLEGGRCGQGLSLPGCGLYDPQSVYEPPQAEKVVYSGEIQRHVGKIGSSYGMDFVEVILSPTADGQPMSVAISVNPGDVVELRVLALGLLESKDGKLQPSSADSLPEALEADQNGKHCLSIHEIDSEAYSRLGLVIVRVDAGERADPRGSYTIDLMPRVDC